MNDTDRQHRPEESQRFLVINPNTNANVTGSIREMLRSLVPPGVIAEAVNPGAGPYAVESERDKASATRHVLELIRERMAEGYAGYVLACFDDIAIVEARALTSAPVISLAEAGIRQAHATGGPFTVITTFEEAVATIVALCDAHGMGARCTVKATGIGVTDTAARTARAEARLHGLVERAIAEGATAIVLGSGAFAGRAGALQARYGIEVMDGFAEALDYVMRNAEAPCRA
ncbi:aspartate/glutamate racemase family protein [Billgrantia endophytica]|uniref:Asp/Glu racemase n=1 Tax=Billgrantia endophytica TaxID=2033802 RepID=A0A2N7TW95_9GAMM|nr:aspartate/glutamate racemase family protein [Halomonas endophytica]PMR72446.1 Asp/Glu racemase [Halomonas endophytica]